MECAYGRTHVIIEGLLESGFCTRHAYAREVIIMARPPKFTETVSTRILEGLKKGSTLGEAAASADISLRTLQNWLAEGRAAKSGAKKQFVEDVEIARYLGRSHLLSKLDAYAEVSKDWRAVAWRLERLAPSEYCPTSQAFAKRIEEEDRHLGNVVEGTDSESIDDEVRLYRYGPDTEEDSGDQRKGKPPFVV